MTDTVPVEDIHTLSNKIKSLEGVEREVNEATIKLASLIRTRDELETEVLLRKGALTEGRPFSPPIPPQAG